MREAEERGGAEGKRTYKFAMRRDGLAEYRSTRLLKSASMASCELSTMMVVLSTWSVFTSPVAAEPGQ